MSVKKMICLLFLILPGFSTVPPPKKKIHLVNHACNIAVGNSAVKWMSKGSVKTERAGWTDAQEDIVLWSFKPKRKRRFVKRVTDEVQTSSYSGQNTRWNQCAASNLPNRCLHSIQVLVLFHLWDNSETVFILWCMALLITLVTYELCSSQMLQIMQKSSYFTLHTTHWKMRDCSFIAFRHYLLTNFWFI